MTTSDLVIDLTSVSPTAGGVARVAIGVTEGLEEIEAGVRCLVAPGMRQEWVEALPDARIDEVAVRMSAGSGWQTRLRSLLPKSLKTSRLVGAVRRIRSGAVRAAAGEAVVWYPFHRSAATAASSVVTVHDLRVFEADFASEMDQKIITENVRHAKALVCSWPHPYESLIARFPEARGKVFQIPLPVLNSGEASSDRTAPTGTITLLYPAFVTEHKDHATLIRALALMPEARLICTGIETDYANRMRALADSLGVASRVDWRGFVSESELEDAYREADMLVMPSLWEAASGPVLEAVVRRVPFVASDIPPLEAQVRKLGLATADWTFRARDEVALADAVRATVASYGSRVEALAGPAAIVGQQTWRTTASDYHRVFAWVEGSASLPSDLQPEA